MEDEIRTLADIPRIGGRARPDAVALVFGDRRTTYRDLDVESNRAASALAGAGVRRGDRVGLVAKDSLEVYALIFGAAKLGAVALPINWRLQAQEIAWILDDAGARVVYTTPDLRAKLGERDVLATVSGEASDPGFTPGPEDPAVQMYTSGTTGNPKGVVLAHRSFFAVIAEMRKIGDPWIGFGPADVTVLTLPTFHIGGLWWAATALKAGATALGLEAFSAPAVLDLVAKWRVTKLALVPAMIQMVLAEPAAKRTDFSSLGHLVYGGSPIPPALLERARAAFGCRFAQIYGLTETGNMAVCLRPEDHDGPPSRLAAAGRPYPGVTAKVIDPEGRVLPPREIGEICLRSPANMLEYWNNPAATARTLVDGFVHTGDAGFVDEDGYVYVSDRVKDMIIAAGEKIYPAEVENALASHPAVQEVAVIGVPDDRWGERVKAIVVLRKDLKATAPELLAHARKQIATFKVPQSIDFAESLPRTPSGKVKKNVLREPYWAGRSRRVN